jgi:hypothetical protein
MWDPGTGERFNVGANDKSIKLEMGPAGLKVLVFDKEKKGSLYKPAKTSSTKHIELRNSWSLTGKHINGTTLQHEINILKDLKEVPEWGEFLRKSYLQG